MGILIFVLVLVFVVMGHAEKADAATYQFISGYLTVNLDKSVYEPGEVVKVAANVQTTNCGNHSNSDISLAIMKVISPDGSYTGTSQKVIDHTVTGSAAAHDAFYANAYFIAPPYGGSFLMNTDFTFSYYSGGIFKSRKTVKYVFQTPFIVSGCTTPAGYTKCSNENETCSFAGNAKVAYGCSPSLAYKDSVSSSIFCGNDSFGGDPLPNIAKSCFYQTIVAAPIPSVSVYVNSSKTPSPVDQNSSVNVHWDAYNVNSCQCSYFDANGGKIGDCGTGVGEFVNSTPRSISVAKNTTFTVTCTDTNGNVVPVSPTGYFKLQHCTSSNVFQTGPFPSGAYQLGEVLAGALDDGTYDYRVVNSSSTPFQSVGFITGTTRTGNPAGSAGYVCR